MSGGVDSAVALLRAGSGAVGVTLRLWIDPNARDTERTCCSPRAVLAARRACHARGIPHVTLDLREEFRAGRRAAVHRRLRGRRDAEPVRALQRQLPLRRAARVRRPHRRGAARDRPLRARRRARRAPPARASGRSAQGPELHAGRGRRGRARPRLVPARRQTKDETRAEAEAAGLAAARRPESQEACFLGGDDYREFLGRHGLASTPGAVVDEDGRELGSHDGFWRFTPGQRRGLGIAAAEPLYALGADAATNTVVAGPRASLARRRVEVRGSLRGPRAASRPSSATARPRCPRP